MDPKRELLKLYDLFASALVKDIAENLHSLLPSCFELQWSA